MKQYINILLILISGLGFGQKIVTDTVFVQQNKPSIVTIDDDIAQMIIADEIELFNEPLYINNQTILTFKAKKKFTKKPELYIISSKGNHYNIKFVHSDKENGNSYFFVGNKNIQREMDNSMIDENIIVDESYKDDAKRINSMLKRMFSKTKYIQNGFKIELVSSYARANKLFLRFELENNTPYPFVSDEILFKSSQYNSFNRKSSPEEMVKPIYQYSEESLNIPPKGKIYKTFVFEAFKINDDRFLKIVVLERNSAIEYFLPIMAKLINEPETMSFKDNEKKSEKETKKVE